MKKIHDKINMKKHAKYLLVSPKLLAAHLLGYHCDCNNEVTNLLGGKRVWTRIEFNCGERIKINCHCLEKIQ